MKTVDLIGHALDWAVAKCEGLLGHDGKLTDEYCDSLHPDQDGGFSTDWAQGGPIIEREKISVSAWGLINWKALTLRYPNDVETEHTGYGETPLIAAMRCYVASKLGDEVDVPEELK